MVYEPQEDSFLLKTFVQKYAKGVVLDMGTGSGIQALTAAKKKEVKKVVGVDIDPEAIKYAKKHSDHKLITYLQGDLFSPFKSNRHKHFFDTIVFNAPYLPQEGKQKHIDLEGGKRGDEVIERFLSEANNYVKSDGIILLVFSSLTPNVQQHIDRNLFVGKELGKKRHFFEDIYVYLIKKSQIIKSLGKKGVEEIEFFAKGKRGYVFTGDYKNKKVGIKVKNPKSTAEKTITKEADMLKTVNEHGIGPKYIFHTTKFLVYEFVEGKYLKDLLDSKQIKNICRKIFEQCYELDLLHINKQEMTRPYKHVIVNKNKIILIDFERAQKDKEAHNVTQFCQYVMAYVDKKNENKWIAAATKYAKDRSRKSFEKILELF
ncbi:hypothetical protein COV18_03020 [Candidatus Woesearchaeota archaeon CG10_big_fil_rev_8_21_14_0_10_37_12]|nr:MAG: hypothetical protein COV18_03020 [Candidatus Woesearchaeota archaeon CG10_big_fil_rev_8_21_14_0_10_37_12]